MTREALPHGVWSHGPNVTEADHCAECRRLGPLVTLTQAQYGHLRAAPAPTLDVERLARALHGASIYCNWRRDSTKYCDSASAGHREQAKRIAAAYEEEGA